MTTHAAAGDPRDVVVAFANTHADGGGAVEQFPDADGLRRWVESHRWLGAGDGGGTITDADATEARELRDALVTVLLTHAHDSHAESHDVEDAAGVLLRAGQRYPVTVEMGRGAVRLSPAHGGIPGVLAAVLAAIAELSLAGDWQRVKACRNQPCHTAFVDRTRNTSGAFCSPPCASQSAMRAYRARQRHARDTIDDAKPEDADTRAR